MLQIIQELFYVSFWIIVKQTLTKMFCQSIKDEKYFVCMCYKTQKENCN